MRARALPLKCARCIWEFLMSAVYACLCINCFLSLATQLEPLVWPFRIPSPAVGKKASEHVMDMTFRHGCRLQVKSWTAPNHGRSNAGRPPMATNDSVVSLGLGLLALTYRGAGKLHWIRYDGGHSLDQEHGLKPSQAHWFSEIGWDVHLSLLHWSLCLKLQTSHTEVVSP